MKLQDKVAIVTGAARGIGRAIAELFHQEGAQVLIADVLEELGPKAAAEIAIDSPMRGSADSCVYHHTDVSREDEVQRMVAACVERFGRLDILVNNAGLARNSDTTQLDTADWLYVLNVNLSATLWSAKHAAPHLIAAGGGAIVSIASVHGLHAAARHAAYEASKGGLLSLVRELAAEFGPQGIRVNAISPGHIITPEREADLSEQHRWFYAHNYPLRRSGKPIEIAKAALFLASDDSSFVTGHNLVVDGGMTIWLCEDQITNLARDLAERPQPWV